MKKAASALLIGATVFAVVPARADTVTAYGDAVCSAGSCLLTAGTVPFGYSGIDIVLSTPIAIGAITNLSVNFTDIAGGSSGGSPRIELDTSGANFFNVYLGPPPSFNDTNPVTFTANYSGFNLINATSDSAFQNTGAYVPFSSLAATYTGNLISEFAFIVETPGQALTFNSITLNDQTYTVSSAAAVPGPIVGAGLPGFVMMFGGLLAALRRRRSVTA